MASQSLYRKWRSQTFSDLVGQEAVVRTLLNAVRDGRLAHAYLFCGPRGTGKTSTARLLAKAVNCANPQNGEPCNECVSCREITTGRAPDVIEIDAASNTGVDNIRDLRENVNLLGSGGHYKVYVVDECFSYAELVTLADGSKMPIGTLVETQWQGEVLSYNEQTGEIEPKPIARHMRKQASVPTVRVTFDNNRSIVCTINHKFYTPDGQVCAGHLAVGQFVYTNRERITQRQRAVVMGAVLGDGHSSLTGSAMRARWSMTQGVAQKDYLDYKVHLLGDLVESPPRFQDGAGTYSKTGTYHAVTLSRPEIAQIHRELYGNGDCKTITRSYLDQIDELGLALWYLDDGALTTQNHRYSRVKGGISVYPAPATRSSFSTHCFTMQEAQEICAWLREQWRIEGGVANTGRGPVVWLTLPGTARLHELIAQYVPPSMQYKLLPDYRGRFQAPADDSMMASGLAVSVVRAIEPVPMPEFVYNIEVADNHNYFVRDMLVANCHMLTVSAFNALLKTLEEPPPHVIFVLATTEAHKVLQTVVSRCQRFDFRRIGVGDIVARLRYVAEGEGLELDLGVAELLARAAQGGLRDALSLLDQAMAFCGTHIDLERTRRMLGLADPTLLRLLIEHVAEQRTAEGLHLIHELVVSGADLRQITMQLAEEWRALMLSRAGADVAALMDRTAEEASDLHALAERFSLEALMACARVFARNETPARGLPVPQLALELAFLECISIRANGGEVRVQPAAIAATPEPRPMPVAPSLPAPTPAVAAVVPTPSQPQAAVMEVEELDLDAIEAGEAPPIPVRVPAPVSISPMSYEPLPEDDDLEPEPDDFEPVAAPVAIVATSGRDWLAEVQQKWPLVKKVCRQKSAQVSALLNSVQPALVEPGTPPLLVIQAKATFHLEKLREPAKREAVEWALEQVLETPMRVRLALSGETRATAKVAARSVAPVVNSAAPVAPAPHAVSAPPISQNGHGPAAAPPMSSAAQQNGHAASANAATAQPAPSQQALEEEVRADPVVREILKTGAVELAEVRPLLGDEA